MSTPLSIAEGFRLDHFGNLVSTTYVDLRDPGSREPIAALIKGSRPEHAIESCRQVRIAAPRSFRNSGENLIRDPAEGRFSRTRASQPVTDDPQDLARAEQRNATLNRLSKLVGFEVRHRTTSVRRDGSETYTLDYAPVGWLFCTSIEPSTPEQWRSWGGTLEDGRDHVSHIYRPREFAFALGQMAVERLGPQGASVPLTSSLRDRPSSRTLHPSQTVFHGPVVYVEDVDAWLRQATSEADYVLRSVFTKSATHRDQREYRFLVWSESEPDCDAYLLDASPALIDAMTRRGNDPTPLAIAAAQPDGRVAGAEHSGAAQPNPLDGTDIWLGLAKSMGERARLPGAVVRPSRPDPASPPADYDRQLATYAAVTALRRRVESILRMDDQSAEFKQAVAAAAWFAEQDLRALCAEFDDPVTGISFDDDGYIVIRIEVAELADAACRLAVAPTGESAITFATGDLKRLTLGVAPFYRANVGQQVREFIAEQTP